MSLLAGNGARRSYSTRPEAKPMRSDRIGRQIDDPENSSQTGIADKVNPLAIPVIVEVAPLQGV